MQPPKRRRQTAQVRQSRLRPSQPSQPTGPTEPIQFSLTISERRGARAPRSHAQCKQLVSSTHGTCSQLDQPDQPQKSTRSETGNLFAHSHKHAATKSERKQREARANTCSVLRELCAQPVRSSDVRSMPRRTHVSRDLCLNSACQAISGPRPRRLAATRLLAGGTQAVPPTPKTNHRIILVQRATG